MTKRAILGTVLALGALCSTQMRAQTDERESKTASPAQLTAASFTYTHQDPLGAISAFHQFEIVFTGSVSATSISITPYMRGGTAGTAVTSTTVGSQVLSVTGTWDYYVVVVSWTGSPTAMKVNVTGTHASARAGGGASSGAAGVGQASNGNGGFQPQTYQSVDNALSGDPRQTRLDFHNSTDSSTASAPTAGNSALAYCAGDDYNGYVCVSSLSNGLLRLYGVYGSPSSTLTTPTWNPTNHRLEYAAPATSSSIANATLTVGTTAVAASSCSSAGTVTMTGVVGTTAFSITPAADLSSITGWGPATPGLYLDVWPTANTLNWKVCNSSTASITPGASETFNVGPK